MAVDDADGNYDVLIVGGATGEGSRSVAMFGIDMDMAQIASPPQKTRSIEQKRQKKQQKP